MSSAFNAALSSGQTAVEGYLTSAAPVIGVVAVAFLGIKYLRRIVRGL